MDEEKCRHKWKKLGIYRKECFGSDVHSKVGRLRTDDDVVACVFCEICGEIKCKTK